jgi:hypothetical protein
VIGEEILRLRRKGLRPHAPVIVSLVGRLRSGFPVVVIPMSEPIQGLDLRMMVDLDVIIAHAGQSTARTVELADALFCARVRNLECWNVKKDRWVAVVFHHEKVIKEMPPCI